MFILLNPGWIDMMMLFYTFLKILGIQDIFLML